MQAIGEVYVAYQQLFGGWEKLWYRTLDFDNECILYKDKPDKVRFAWALGSNGDLEHWSTGFFRKMKVRRKQMD